MSTKKKDDPVMLFDYPGEYIQCELDKQRITQIGLAKKLKVRGNEINRIVTGNRFCTPTFAFRFEKELGIKAEVLMQLQLKYEMELLKTKIAGRIDRVITVSKKRRDEVIKAIL